VDKVLEVVKTMDQERTMELDQLGGVRTSSLLVRALDLGRAAMALASLMGAENPMAPVRALEVSRRVERAVPCLLEVRLKPPVQLKLLLLLRLPVQLKLPAQLKLLLLPRLQVLLKQPGLPSKRLALLPPPEMQRKPLQMLLSLLRLSQLRPNPLMLSPLMLNLLKLNPPTLLSLILPNPLIPRIPVTRTRALKTLIQQIQEATQSVTVTQLEEIRE
jgi:hypothetical protein